MGKKRYRMKIIKDDIVVGYPKYDIVELEEIQEGKEER